MAGRHEGVSRITDSLTNLPPGESVYLVAFLLDRLQAFIQRYGPPVAEELVFRVIKERVQPIASGDITFRWTSSSLVAVLKGQRDLAALQTQPALLSFAHEQTDNELPNIGYATVYPIAIIGKILLAQLLLILLMR